MRFHFILFLSSFFLLENPMAQCVSGAMGVSGVGCGCIAGCNLTSFGGPNCGSGTTGNCSSGYTNMTPLDVVVPSGCTITVTALMENRPGCSAAGADGDCQTCDGLKVDVFPGGVKINQQGGSNASLTDSYTLVGPGTIRITGRANRADEIVTYTTSSTICVDCGIFLPIELIDFTAVAQKSTVDLKWVTASELNNDYFTIERSKNGIDFEAYAVMTGSGTSQSVQHYTMVDSSPMNSVSYYRIKQTDYDGTHTYSHVRAVNFKAELDISLFPNPSNGTCFLVGKHISESEIVLMDALGKVTSVSFDVHSDRVQFETEELMNGVYIVSITHATEQQLLKLVVQH